MAAEPKITVDHLLGMHAVAEQLRMRCSAKKKFAKEHPDDEFVCSPEYIRGYDHADSDAAHLLGETLIRVLRTDRPTYDAYKEALRGK